MRHLFIVLAIFSFLAVGDSAAMAGCCCKPPKLEKMTKPPPSCCLCGCKKPKQVGESYMGKGNGTDVSPCCDPPREHRLFHKRCP